MKRHTDKIIVVEGKYDKIRLENLIDGVIITTEGFGIFNSPEKRELLRKISESREIIVLTDSDSAGSVIRSHIATITGKKNLKNIYAPRIAGKEKRKSTAGKEGILGIEGTPDDIIIGLLDKAGAFSSDPAESSDIRPLTKADLYKLGYYGSAGASEKRAEYLRARSLPENLSPNAFLDVINLLGL